MAVSNHYRIVIVGGGSAGLSVAARLVRAGQEDVAVVDPAEMHYYQPLWTLVGGGCAPVEESVRAEASVMPEGVSWIRQAATGIDPDAGEVELSDGSRVGYDVGVICPGIQLDWGRVGGLSEAMTSPAVSSNYGYDTAPKTWELVRSFTEGTAVFTMPSGPIKCAGAPQKIAYLACDWWRRQGVLERIRRVLVLPTPTMFGVKEFSDVLEQVAARYGIEVHCSSEVVEVDPEGRTVTVVDHAKADSKTKIDYDLLHAVPPQSAPDWIKQSPVAAADTPAGWVEVDKGTHQHMRYPNLFSLGDAGSTPNSKTGAAIRKQAPVVAANVVATLEGKDLPATYDGYASCPITTARNRMLLAEFDYTMKPHPTVPLIDTKQERYDMWLLKRYGLPYLYWNLMLKGLA